MRKLGTAAALFLALGVATASAGALTPITVGIPGNSIDFAMWFIGSDAGIFRKNGLDVTFARLDANTLPAALVSNGIQVTPLSTSVMSGNLAGFAVKLIGQLNLKLDYMIIGDKSIASVKGLKGKTIVTGPPRGGPNGLLVYELAKNGIDAKKDVKLLYIGSEEARRTLIEAHAADAIIDDVPHALELEERNPNLHTILSNEDVPNLFGTSAGVSADLIEKDPDLLLSLLRALVETKAFVKAHPDETAALLQKELTLSPGIAKGAAEVVRASLAPSLVPSPAMYQGEAEIESMLMDKTITAARMAAAWDTHLAAAVEKEQAGK